MSIDKNIEREGPFKDLFEERQIFGENFIKFIESIDSADNTNFLNIDEREITRVISIDAEWGFGKTTFLNALEKALILKDFTVFKFNAWENDLEKEPLSAFVRVLLPQIIHATGQNFEDIIKYKRKMSNFIAATNTIITQTTKFLPIIPETDILKIIEDTKKNTKYLMEQESETIKCGMSKSNEISLKNDFINSLNSIFPTNNKKIIVLIDELDRCNPSFAIELLERIKHFFDTEKYLFIFTINSNQLKSSVKQIYGEGFQETGYFRRFFDYEFYLPEPDKYQYLSDKLSIINTNDTFHKYILYYFHNQNISLRDCNKIINFPKFPPEFYMVR